MKIRAIVTGATGMVGEGVLHECLQHPAVERVLVLGRRSCGVTHPKLTEVLHADFHDLSAVEDRLAGYNACYFCLGATSVGLTEAAYHRLSYDLTIHVAETLVRLNPDMTFCYVSGSGTDSTERGKSMWARVKGKTENRLLQMPFKDAYMFRPGYMQPTKGLKNAKKWYAAMAWLYPVWRAFFSKYVSTLGEVGIAMINAVKFGSDKKVLEVQDIVQLAKR